MVVSSFIDSGVGLVLSIWFVLAVILNSESNFIIAKLTLSLGVVWCSSQTNRLHVYRCLLTNRLHVKAAESCLANS